MPNFNNEESFLNHLKELNTKKALVLSGDQNVFYEHLVLMENIELYQSSNIDYKLIYFYKGLETSQINLVNELFPKIITINMDCLLSMGEIYLLFSKSNWKLPVTIKYYLLKLLEIIDSTIYLDSDMLIIKNIFKALDELNDKSFDISLLDYKLSNFEKNNLLKPYFDKNENIENIPIYNTGFLYLNSSFIKKINFNDLNKILKNLCTNKQNNPFLLSTDKTFCAILYKSNLIIKNCSSRFNCLTYSINNTTDDIVIFHFSTKLFKPSTSYTTQLNFPLWQTLINNLLYKLKTNTSLDTININHYYLNISKLDLLKNSTPELSLNKALNLLNLLKKALPQICNFIKDSKYFYLEPLQNDEKLLIFNKDTWQYTRISIQNTWGRDYNIQSCAVEYRISFFGKDVNIEQILNDSKFLDLSKKFFMEFPFSEIDHTSDHIKFIFLANVDSIECYLHRFETFYEKYLREAPFI